MDEQRRREIAEAAAEAAGDVARRRFRTDVTVERKEGKTDLVTEADREAQRRARETIAEAFPGEPLIAEENDARETIPDGGPAWIVDPIDGTSNFVRGVPLWCTAVAAIVDAEPVASVVAAPALGDRYVAGREATLNGDPLSVSDRADPEACAACPTVWWSREDREAYAAVAGGIIERFGDLRRWGSTQLELAAVASGALDAALTRVNASPWDTIAGVHLIRLAGGQVTDREGGPWRHDADGLVATNGKVHEDAIAAVQSG